uniref:Membrane progestin receptor beta-like n=1 Tax=Gouania willdenowi TaxID=441366 RepID=A0A8C5DU33_GOUWI
PFTLGLTFALPSLSYVCRPLLDSVLPSLPPTVSDLDVPPLLREHFILSGYRPLGLPWRCCVLSLLQIHNQTLTTWSLLLAALALLLRFTGFAFLRGGVRHRLCSKWHSNVPLILSLTSKLSFLASCSAAANVLHCRSEEMHYFLFFLHSVSAAVYQYGCALALSLYSVDAIWTQSMLGQVYLPLTAILSWLSCALCCYTKLTLRSKFAIHRRICRLFPMGVAFLVIMGPFVRRLTIYRWSNGPALMLFLHQVVLFLLSTFFFCFPVPECFAPGHYDLAGNSHHVYHALRSLCTLVQQEALFHDFLWRRPALVRQMGEQHLLLTCISFFCPMVCCSMTALAMRSRARAELEKEQR